MKRALITIAAAALLGASSMGLAQSGAQVFKAKGCGGCHDAQAKKIGPSLKEIAAKHKGSKTAAVGILARLKEGKGHVKISGPDAEIMSAVQYMLGNE